ncbi:MAG TPA: HigA family addiction module antitoxin [Candidatus Baltobacteraceae bacterium]|jgi:addiction module HigA family antidote
MKTTTADRLVARICCKRAFSSSLTQQDLADAIGLDRPSVNALLNGRRSVTSRTALRLERALGVSAQFWLNLQQDIDLWDARHDRDLTHDLRLIKRIGSKKSM